MKVSKPPTQKIAPTSLLDTLGIANSEHGADVCNLFFSLYKFTAKINSYGKKDVFVLDKRRARQVVHRLGITHVLVVQSQNFVITLSFDNSMRVFDAMTGNPFLSVDNPHRCRYTSAVR